MSEQSQPESISGSLVTTLAESDLVSVLTDVSELTLDSIMNEGVLQDLPVVATIKGIWKTGKNIRDLLFLKKLANFLIELKDISPSDRTDMLKRLEEDERYTQRVGESMILLLDRLDHLDKPALVGRAFRAFCAGHIDAAQLQRLNHVVDRAFMPDLQELQRHAQAGGDRYPRSIEEGLVDCGLAWVEPNSATTKTEPTKIFDPFVKYVLLS